MKSVKITVPIYNAWVWVVSDEEECSRLCDKHLGYQLSSDDYTARGMTIFGCGSNVIWLPEKAEISTVAHECLHTVFNICRVHGIEADLKNQEPVTYLMGWLTQAVVNARRKLEKANG